MLVYSWFLLLRLFIYSYYAYCMSDNTHLKIRCQVITCKSPRKGVYSGQHKNEVSMSSDSYPQTYMIHVLPLSHWDWTNCFYVNFFFENSKFWKKDLFGPGAQAQRLKGHESFDSYECVDLNYGDLIFFLFRNIFLYCVKTYWVWIF